jgi:hypothetical protein
VEREEEVQHLIDYFLTQAKMTYPIGIWAGRKHPTEDDGLVPEESLNIKNYPIMGKPILVIVDGKGMIRRVFTGYEMETETLIARTVEFLLREAGDVSVRSPKETL